MSQEPRGFWYPDKFEVYDLQHNRLDKIRTALSRDLKLKNQYTRVRNLCSKGVRYFEIPIVVDKGEGVSSIDDGDIVLIGDAVTWPVGVAEKIIKEELFAATAFFQIRKRNKVVKDKKIEVKNPSSRKHSRMKVSIQHSAAIGQRHKMEDRFVIHLFNDIAVFGVFDGHGGTEAAEIASNTLIPFLRAEFRNSRNSENNETQEERLEGCLIRSVAEVEKLVLERLKEFQDASGTTLCVSLLTRNSLIVANLGDSRIVLCRSGVATKVTGRDHRPDDISEVSRIQDAGGFVDSHGYVGGFVQVTRAIGDINPDTKAKIIGLSSIPETTIFSLDMDKDEFIIIACDGLWDVISEKGAVEFVRKFLAKTKGDLLQTADALVNHALQLKTLDNVTVVIAAMQNAERIWNTPLSTSTPPVEDPSEIGRPRFKFKSLKL